MPQYISSSLTAYTSHNLSRTNTGLGNTLFQIASVYGISKMLNINCVFPVLYNFGKKLEDIFGYDHLYTIYKNVPTNISENTPFEFCRGSGFLFDTNLINYISSTTNNIIIEGYLQNYKYIMNYESEIRYLFLDGIGKYIQSVKNDNIGVDWDKSVFLHVRRGDYLKNPHIHTNQPFSYYEKAITRFSPEIKNIFLFSDDVEFLKDEAFFSSDPRFKVIANPNELYNLAFMSLCRGGAICANSTFSWWGAFLGTYSIRGPVIVPRDWIRNGEDFSGLFPPEWTQI